MLRSWAVALGLVAALGAQAQSARPPIFVLNSLDADISVIDPVSFTVVKRFPTGKEPHHLYLSPDEKSLIVANALGDSLTFVDPRTADVQRVVRGIPDPYHLRFSPDMKWFVTASNRLDRVDLYRWQGSTAAEPLQLVKRIPAPKTPSHLNIDTKSTTLYVSLQDSDELLAIDLATQAVKWKQPVGKMPADIYLTPDDKHILVGLTGDSVVEVWDVSGAKPKLVKRLPTGNGAHSFRAWGDQRHVLVSNRAANTISKIDLSTFTVVDQFPGPAGPDDMEVMGDGKTLLVTSRWAGKLTQIDTTTRKVVRQVKVGKSPHGLWTLDHKPRL
ncbi:YncE family protein [Roseateles sp. BYS87W]|uniref:YncE family protein n=1 Tax=Pelomonas baiyunensis TaxID=3299026 RepID=A0ABW7GV07_9BURK